MTSTTKSPRRPSMVVQVAAMVLIAGELVFLDTLPHSYMSTWLSRVEWAMSALLVLSILARLLHRAGRLHASGDQRELER